jgi:glycerol kinase
VTEPTLLAIDQGTTSSRAILFSRDARVLATHQIELPQIYPQKSWVEHDPDRIWTDTLAACRAVIRDDCIAIGITNQRETTILWNRKTGAPLYNAIVWQDKRTSDLCAQLRAAGHEKTVTEKTGLLLDPYFSASKIKWILDHVPGARIAAERGDVAFGTVDCWLLWKLTGGRVHATDATNASRTGIFNIVTHAWDDELLALYDIPRALLPTVLDNVAHFGDTDPSLFGRAIPIGGMAGDQHAALIGQGCFETGMMKSTYGTGCFALMPIGDTFRVSRNRLLTTIAYRLNGRTCYACEGSIFIAGAAVQWLRDNLGIIEKSADSETLALSVADNNGVYFIPAFSGLGAPHWRPDARAAIFGMTRDTTRAHIVRAALEAQGYQTLDLLQAMHADTGVFPRTLRVDGGMAVNHFVCQFLADMLQCAVDIPSVTETTALGAAYLAGLYAGLYADTTAIGRNWARAARVEPRITPQARDALYAGWTQAVGRLLS